MSNDPWKHRSDNMKCKTCMWFAPKITTKLGVYDLGRCRRHAPTMNGYPVVFVNDWCGDHKLDENKLIPECGVPADEVVGIKKAVKDAYNRYQKDRPEREKQKEVADICPKCKYPRTLVHRHQEGCYCDAPVEEPKQTTAVPSHVCPGKKSLLEDANCELCGEPLAIHAGWLALHYDRMPLY